MLAAGLPRIMRSLSSWPPRGPSDGWEGFARGSRPDARRGAASGRPMRRESEPTWESAPWNGADSYDTEKVNDTSAVPPVVTVTFWVWVPSASCHASMT